MHFVKGKGRRSSLFCSRREEVFSGRKLVAPVGRRFFPLRNYLPTSWSTVCRASKTLPTSWSTVCRASKTLPTSWSTVCRASKPWPRRGRPFVRLQNLAYAVVDRLQGFKTLPTLWSTVCRASKPLPRCGRPFAGLQNLCHVVGNQFVTPL